MLMRKFGGAINVGVYYGATKNQVDNTFSLGIRGAIPGTRCYCLVDGVIIDYEDADIYGRFLKKWSFLAYPNKTKEFYFPSGTDFTDISPLGNPNLSDWDFTLAPSLSYLNSRYIACQLYDFSNCNMVYIENYDQGVICNMILGHLHPDLWKIRSRGNKMIMPSSDEHNNYAPNLTHIDVGNAQQINPGIGNMQNMVELTDLRLTGNTENQSLDTFTKLTTLILISCSFTLTNIANLPLLGAFGGEYIYINGGNCSVDYSSSTVLWQISQRRTTNYLLPEHVPPNLTWYDSSQNENMKGERIGQLWIKLDALGKTNGYHRYSTAAIIPPEYDAVRASLVAKGWNIFAG